MEKKRYALVTGASSGLGNAIAAGLSSEGYIVFAGIRNEADKQLFAGKAGIVPIILDVTKQQDIENAFQFILHTAQDSGLAVLINNAGINYITAFELADENRERQLIEVNLLGAMSLTRKLLPFLHQYVKTTNAKAKIVNISSIGGVFGLPWEAAYHASKFAMIGFSQSLRYELEPLNISVCCFVPGGMKTEIFRKSAGSSETPHQRHTHLIFYRKNIQHMKTVMQKFDRSAAPAQRAAQAIANILRKETMPLRKYFGKDATFIRIFTWLGLQGILKNQFTIR